MMPKKATLAGGSGTPALADQLSALLCREELPEELYNPLAEALHDLASQARVTLLTPEVLRVALPIILDRLGAAEGVRRG